MIPCPGQDAVYELNSEFTRQNNKLKKINQIVHDGKKRLNPEKMNET